MKSFGFTLAEVLITLGIIGIVAAMTLPSLIQNNKKKELQAALLKNYSILQAALNKATYEYGETINTQNTDNFRLKPILMAQLKYVKDCTHSNCVPYNKEENENGDVINFVIKNYKTYNKKQTVQTHFFDDGQFMLNDGSMYLLENPLGIYNRAIFITIDINGIDKKPNCWGHDLFTFQIMDNGKLLPMGADTTKYSEKDYCSSTSNDRLNGIACTHRALTDKNYWKNLPK